MIDKNVKLPVMSKMIGIGDEVEPQFIVPQNSFTNMRNRMGLTERQTGGSLNFNNGIFPLDTTSPNKQKCIHCENMAKNFLYLESLIRSNYNPKNQCGLCFSSLKYLQFVNKSILQVFGNLDSIVEAAKIFAGPQKRTFTLPTNSSINRIPIRKSKINNPNTNTTNTERILPKATSKAEKSSILLAKSSAVQKNKSKKQIMKPMKKTGHINKSNLKVTAPKSKLNQKIGLKKIASKKATVISSNRYNLRKAASKPRENVVKPKKSTPFTGNNKFTKANASKVNKLKK